MARKKKTEEQMQLFESGGTPSQKDKANKSFSEMDDMLKKGISEQVKKEDGTVISKTYKDPSYAAEDVLRMLREGKISVEQAEKFLREQKDAGNYAKGGMEDGGLKDEGGTVDPVSGNDVPPGSTQSEVRDDIPAQLSEGEFVFPADVVRYVGLENLMELRSKAKQGLAKMEAMGQMGNADEATMDDSGEYDGEIDELIESFDPNDPSTFEFNEGGVVMAQQGTYVPPNTRQQQFSYGYGYGAGTGYTPPGQQPVQYPQYGQFISRPAQQIVGEQPPQIEDRQYIGPNGELITIRFMNGKPQQQIPAGFKVYKPEEAVAPTSPVVARPTTTGGGGDSDGGGDNKESYDTYRSNMDKLSALDEKFGAGKFSEEWNNSVHKQQGFSLSALNLSKNIADDISRGALADKVITDIADKYGLDPSNFKQKGLGKLQPGEYDVDSFLRSASAAPAPTLETNTGRPSGFLDENTYVDSSGNVRDVTAKSAQTKAGLEIESSRPSTTPIGYDDTEDEASGRTSSQPSGPPGGRGTDAANVDSGSGGMGPSASGPSPSGPSPSASDGSDNDSQSGSGGGGANDGTDSSSGSSGSGGTFICTAAYDTGLTTDSIWSANKKFGVSIKKNDPYLYKGYEVFGPWLANKIREGKLKSFAEFTPKIWAYEQAKNTHGNVQNYSPVVKLASAVYKYTTRPVIRLVGWLRARKQV